MDKLAAEAVRALVPYGHLGEAELDHARLTAGVHGNIFARSLHVFVIRLWRLRCTLSRQQRTVPPAGWAGKCLAGQLPVSIDAVVEAFLEKLDCFTGARNFEQVIEVGKRPDSGFHITLSSVAT